MLAFRSVVSVLLRGWETFLYTLKADPAGGLRPPSGPAATQRSPGTGLTVQPSRHQRRTPIGTSISPGRGAKSEPRTAGLPRITAVPDGQTTAQVNGRINRRCRLAAQPRDSLTGKSRPVGRRP
jgi:hypothetical protein